jgi:glycosyltransferase involved in cell wall biosynthesis
MIPTAGLGVGRVALVHDWLTGMRGGEIVLEWLLRLHADAEIFTLFHVPGSVSPMIESRPIHTSFVQRIPYVGSRYRSLLPLFPRAIEGFDLRDFDLVLSSSHCVAKGARVRAGAQHLCYCHTPMRYVWDQFDAYFGPGSASWPVRAAMRVLAPQLRRWDVASAAGVHRFVANSTHVAERIRRCYGREAVVVHPPVSLERFRADLDREDYYLMLGAPAPYKRVDIAVAACARLGRRLVIAGHARLPDPAPVAPPGGASGDVEVLGWLSPDEAAELLGRARALLMPGVEDFGITAVEALASGTPVIALGSGGALDTVVSVGADTPPAPTGVFFDEPTPKALADAILRFEAASFDRAALARSAEDFRPERFLERMRAVERELLA